MQNEKEGHLPIPVSHVLQRFVSQDSSIVDYDINTAECLDRSFNDEVALLYGVKVRHCDSTSLTRYMEPLKAFVMCDQGNSHGEVNAVLL